MIWFSTMSWTSSTDTVWPERLQSHSTLCAASAIWSSVRRSSGTTSPLAPLMALTILLMSNVTSEPLRLMIFMPLTPFLLLAQGALRITFIRAQKATQGMTCTFGNFVKICDLGAFGSLGRCPYDTPFRPNILCFIPLKNPWMGVWSCFPPWPENRETPGRHS